MLQRQRGDPKGLIQGVIVAGERVKFARGLCSVDQLLESSLHCPRSMKKLAILGIVILSIGGAEPEQFQWKAPRGEGREVMKRESDET